MPTRPALISTNPSRNFEVLGEIPMSSPDDIRRKIAAARNAFPAWSRLSLSERLTSMRRFRDVFMAHKDHLSTLISQEMGMPITQSHFNTERADRYMMWSLDHAEESLSPLITLQTKSEINEVIFEPHGVVACISPWNFPASNFVWACFQALIAGNTVVFKNSEDVQLFACEIESIAQESALPDGVLNVIYGDGQVAQNLIAGDIDFICFTGSTRVGQLLYKQAAEKFIPCVLEMGGSDPAIVFADANLEKTIPAIYSGRFGNCGQVCTALKRLIIHESLFDDVAKRLQETLTMQIVGDALDPATTIGPLVSQKQLDLLESQVADALDKGAHIISGGRRPPHLQGGSFYEPTLLTHVTPDMRIWHEEVFGPVLPLVPFSTYDEAIALANDTIYGLSATIFTEDKALAQRATGDLKAGMVKVNHLLTSKPCNPFGGQKLSGIGLENGTFGFHDVCRKKIIAREI